MAAIATVLVSCEKTENTPNVKDNATDPFVGIWMTPANGISPSLKINNDNTYELQRYSYGSTGIGINEKLTSIAYTETGTYEYSENTGILVMIDRDVLDPVTGGKSSVIITGDKISNCLVLTDPFTSESNTLTMTNMSTLTTFSWVRVPELNSPANLKGLTLSSNEYPDITIEFTSDTECLIQNTTREWVLPPAPYRYVQCLWGSFLTSDLSDWEWGTELNKWEEKYLNGPAMRGEITEQEYSEFCSAYGDMLSFFREITTEIDKSGKYYLRRWKFSDSGHFTISHGDYSEILFSGFLH